MDRKTEREHKKTKERVGSERWIKDRERTQEDQEESKKRKARKQREHRRRGTKIIIIKLKEDKKDDKKDMKRKLKLHPISKLYQDKKRKWRINMRKSG